PGIPGIPPAPAQTIIPVRQPKAVVRTVPRAIVGVGATLARDGMLGLAIKHGEPVSALFDSKLCRAIEQIGLDRLARGQRIAVEPDAVMIGRDQLLGIAAMYRAA
ncbi:MAG: hypothetical protein CFE32_24290, partial [Alphaproteobacteria bacterium PA3]